MRRRLEAFIPIVVLAVLVQLMAPIAAFRVVAYATTDPLYLASLCSGMTSASDTPADPARHSISTATAVPFAWAAMAAPLPSIRRR